MEKIRSASKPDRKYGSRQALDNQYSHSSSLVCRVFAFDKYRIRLCFNAIESDRSKNARMQQAAERKTMLRCADCDRLEGNLATYESISNRADS